MEDLFSECLEEAVSAALSAALAKGNRAISSIENAVAAWEGAKSPKELEKDIRGLIEEQKRVASVQKLILRSRNRSGSDGAALIGKAASQMG